MNPNGSGIPYWIFVYIPITVPIGQALMRGLKYFEFSSKLKKEHGEESGKDVVIDIDAATVEEDEEEEEEKRPKKKKSAKKPRLAEKPHNKKRSAKKDK
jgi:hypothetical protein